MVSGQTCSKCSSNQRLYHATMPLSPPPPTNSHTEMLCCVVEDEKSFDQHAMAVLKDRRVVGHFTCCYFLQNIAGSLASRLLPPAARLNGSAESLASGNPSEIRPGPVLKLFSTRLIHEYNSSTLATCVHMCKNCSSCKPAGAARAGGGGCV